MIPPVDPTRLEHAETTTPLPSETKSDRSGEPPATEQSAGPSSQVSISSSFRGPGLFEAGAWIAAFFILQVLATFCVIAGQIVWNMATSEAGQPGLVQVTSSTAHFLVFAAVSGLTYAVLVPAGLLRLRPQPLRRLGFALPRARTTLLLVSMVLPLSIVTGEAFGYFEALFLDWVASTEELAWLAELDVHTFLSKSADGSIFAAFLCLAVIPALGEEFLFRGLIGRGLVQRWGTVAGVILTSLLFALVHLYPPHVLAIIPVGIVLHISYLATGTILAPILVHFLNNSLATGVVYIGLEDADVSPLAFGVSLGYVVLGSCWLVRSRRTPRPASTESGLNAETLRHSRSLGMVMSVSVMVLMVEAWWMWAAVKGQ